MKIKVVGWTDYDFFEFKEGENSSAVRMALVDEIKKNGYLFTGYDHQTRSNCAPVFNDGKMRRFSQRGFADIMAEAQGKTDYMAYAIYMHGFKESACCFPKTEVFKGDFKIETNLLETFELQVDDDYFEKALITESITINNITITKKVIKLDDVPELRYIDNGDTLVLKCNGKSKAFSILGVKRERDLTNKERMKYMSIMSYSNDSTTYNKARQEFMAIPIVLTLTVKQRRKW